MAPPVGENEVLHGENGYRGPPKRLLRRHDGVKGCGGSCQQQERVDTYWQKHVFTALTSWPVGFGNMISRLHTALWNITALYNKPALK